MNKWHVQFATDTFVSTFFTCSNMLEDIFKALLTICIHIGPTGCKKLDKREQRGCGNVCK
jgi:hypothetical protein